MKTSRFIELEVARAKGRPARFVLNADDSVLIGRSPVCEVFIDDPLIAAEHARLSWKQEADGAGSDVAMLELLSPTPGAEGELFDDSPLAVGHSVTVRESLRMALGPLSLWWRWLPDDASPGARAKEADGDPIPPAAELLAAELAAGRYRIEQEVGRGGVGVVHEAEELPLRRPVAMKVLLDTDSTHQQYRFLEEARITGQLEHPNIVPVHDLCVDGEGRIFYTMKLIKGKTLSEVLRRLTARNAETLAQYDLAALLTAYQKICDAMAFAHSKGVIHRDLKPDNVMVGDYGEVLVMDWGLAKVLPRSATVALVAAMPPAPSPPATGDDGVPTVISGNASPPTPPAPAHGPTTRAAHARKGGERVQSLREESSHFEATLDGDIVGTPSYMAPEQARGEVATLDVRADIYALGAILYSILTLRPPVDLSEEDAQELKRRREQHLPLGRSFWSEVQPRMLERVRQGKVALLLRQPPPRGSAGAKPPHLPDGVPDSLVPVVLKAMHLHREARYATVKDLQADVASYQNGFATSVEQAGAWKQLTLFVRRHRGLSIATATGLLLIAGLSAIFIVQVVAERNRTRQQRDRAEAERNNALAAKHDAEELVRYLQYDVTDLLESVGRRKMVGAINERVLAYSGNHPPEDSEFNALHIHLRAHEQEGLLRVAKGDSAGALAAFTTANQSAARLLKLRGGDADRADSARVGFFDRGLVHMQRGEYEQAIGLFGQAAEIQRALLPKDAAQPEWKRELSFTCNKLGDALKERGDYPQALQFYREAESIRRALANAQENNPGLRFDLSTVLCRIGDLHLAEKNLPEAKAAFDQQKTIVDDLVAKDPYNPRWQRELALAESRLGDVANTKREYRQAAESYAREQALLGGLLQADPENAFWLSQYVSSLMKLSAVYAVQGRFEQALTVARQAREKAETVAANDRSNIAWKRDLVPGLEQLGDALLEQGQATQALDQFDFAVNIVSDLVAKDPGNAANQIDLADLSLSQVRAVLKIGGADSLARACAFLERGELAYASAARLDDKNQAIKELGRLLQDARKSVTAMGQPVPPPKVREAPPAPEPPIKNPPKSRPKTAKEPSPEPPPRAESRSEPPPRPAPPVIPSAPIKTHHANPFGSGAPGG